MLMPLLPFKKMAWGGGVDLLCRSYPLSVVSLDTVEGYRDSYYVRRINVEIIELLIVEMNAAYTLSFSNVA